MGASMVSDDDQSLLDCIRGLLSFALFVQFMPFLSVSFHAAKHRLCVWHYFSQTLNEEKRICTGKETF